jgi:hypothetical protein
MNMYGGVDVQIRIFLTLALVGDEWSASHPSRSTAGSRSPGTNWIGGWVRPRAILNDVERIKILTLPGLDLQPLSHSECSQLLYRLHYTCSPFE